MIFLSIYFIFYLISDGDLSPVSLQTIKAILICSLNFPFFCHTQQLNSRNDGSTIKKRNTQEKKAVKWRTTREN